MLSWLYGGFFLLKTKLSILQNFVRKAEIITQFKTFKLRKGKTLTFCANSRCTFFSVIHAAGTIQEQTEIILSTVPVAALWFWFTVNLKTEPKSCEAAKGLFPVGEGTQVVPIICSFLFLNHLGWSFLIPLFKVSY